MISLKRKRRLWITIIIFLTLIIVLEISLRKIWGFGDMVLVKEDKDFEYIMMPDQNRSRFGNHIFYNHYSMRSLPIEKNDTCVVMGFGDSVINGGTLTDQDSIATTIVEKEIKNKCNKGFRFLNVSAGSWAPDNCAAYLKRYGDFSAKMIVLFVSSHDAYDDMTFEKVVGIDEGFPDKQYSTAISELVVRYLIPKIKSYMPSTTGKNESSGLPSSLMINKNGTVFNTGFDYFKDYANRKNIPLLICLHAEQEEVAEGSFNKQGKDIINYCVSNHIRLINGLQSGENLSDYRDQIHLNEKGQKLWAGVFLKEIEQTIMPCK